MNQILQTKRLKKVYDGLTAVDEVDFSISEGEFVGIMGASGSGKSTLLNLISTIDTASSGTVIIDGKDISSLDEDELAEFRKSSLGFVFQDYNLLDTLTLRENIALALVIRKSDKKSIDSLIESIAQKLDIAHLLEKYPYEVSGGQRQRCACARAVAVSPKLILADEPTGALDSNSAKSLMETFVQLNQEMNATLLMVTHDAFSACYCQRILFMKDGKIAMEIFKNDLSNDMFLHKILEVSGKLYGGTNNVC